MRPPGFEPGYSAIPEESWGAEVLPYWTTDAKHELRQTKYYSRSIKHYQFNLDQTYETMFIVQIYNAASNTSTGHHIASDRGRAEHTTIWPIDRYLVEFIILLS